MAATRRTSKLSSWFPNAHQPLVVAGPCSAESETQVLTIAKALAQNPKVSLFRAGVWKPRTRPGSFEGVGKVALGWLQSVKRETGLPTAVEVANAHHVEAALEAGMDVLWIGARTTVNPFFVQEIAESLRGVDIRIFVKNPIHPELGLWLGAIERLSQVGVEKILAVHRGFFSTQAAPFRNDPKWELSFDLRAEAPDVPILADPSHIAGDRNLIKEVSQTALDLNLDGLMIETHNDPDRALSDAAQQVTPDMLNQILAELEVKKEEVSDSELVKVIEEIRSRIDVIDESLLAKLSERNELVAEIAKIKESGKMTIFQLNRWFQLVGDRREWGEKLNLDNSLVHDVFQVIHKHSVGMQTQLNKEK